VALQNVRRGIGFLSVSAVVVAGAIAAGPTLAGATPTPKPSVASVTQQLDVLAKQSAQLTEKYNVAQTDADAKQGAATTAAQVASISQTDLDAALQRLREAVLAQYEQPAFSVTGALLTSSSDQGYLDTVTNMSLIATNRSDVVAHFSQALASNKTATATATAAAAAASKVRDDLKAEKVKIEASITQSQHLLSTLSATQRRAYQSRNTIADTAAQLSLVRAVTAHAPPAPSAGAGIAVVFALAQVGKPYRWGSGGPGSYDCSGLTSAAWRAAGVSLPHSAAGQYRYGTHVSFSQLLPGDLMFLYRPIGHVEIYIGNGLAVSAPQSGENIKVIQVSPGDGFVGFTRL
jgi:cell wall-associated NlpC family hydrolase